MKKGTTDSLKQAAAKRAPASRRTRTATAIAEAIETTVAVNPPNDTAPAASPPIEADATPAPERARKPAAPRRVRQACRLSEDEYARLGGLKKRAAGLARPMKRGELLRVGLHVLLRMPDDELFRTLDALPSPSTR